MPPAKVTSHGDTQAIKLPLLVVMISEDEPFLAEVEGIDGGLETVFPLFSSLEKAQALVPESEASGFTRIESLEAAEWWLRWAENGGCKTVIVDLSSNPAGGEVLSVEGLLLGIQAGKGPN